MEKSKRIKGNGGAGGGIVPYKKAGKRRWIAALAGLALAAGMAALLFTEGGQDLVRQTVDRIVSFSALHVFGSSGNGDGTNASGSERNEVTETEGKPEDQDTEIFETDTVIPDNTDAPESNDTESGADSSEAIVEERVLRDLSVQERGSGFFINHTMLSPNVESLLKRRFSTECGDGRPVVLILHSKTSETYVDADEFGKLATISGGVVSVGERIATELQRQGIPAVHCTVIHDRDPDKSPQRSAGETVASMLKIYPTVRYIIDVGRMDEADESGRAIGTMSPLGTAQIQLTVGRGGEAMEDLALALCLRRELNRGERGLCMPVVLSGAETVGNASAYYLKLEVGGRGNTAEEAQEAGVHFAYALASLLK